jgi:gas vesicle protein
MTAETHDRRDDSFWIGLLAGTAIGAGLAMWLVPRATEELRERATESANHLKTLATDQYRKAATRVEEAVAAVGSSAAGVKSPPRV